jgi:hypothetical protein
MKTILINRGAHLTDDGMSSAFRLTSAAMAYFAGTGPDGSRCGQCRYHAMTAAKIKSKLPEEWPGRNMKCLKAISLRRRKAEGGVHSLTPACKYFEPKP